MMCVVSGARDLLFRGRIRWGAWCRDAREGVIPG